MDFHQIEQFIAVVKYGSVTRAAKELFTSQPSLSRSLASLEAELGIGLFDRGGKQLRINEPGLAALRCFEEISASYRGMRGALERLQNGETGSVRVGIVYAALNPEWQQDAVRNFCLSRPDVSLYLFQMDPAEAVQRLTGRGLDFVISSETPDIPGVRWLSLYEEEIGVLIGRDNPLAEKPALTLLDLKNEPFHMINANSDFKRMSFSFFDRAGVRPPIASEVDLNNISGDLIASGRGFTFISLNRHRSVNQSNIEQEVMTKTVFRPLAESFNRRVCCVGYYTRRFMPRAAADLLSAILIHFGVTPPTSYGAQEP